MTRPSPIESTALEALFNCGAFGLALADARQIVFFSRGTLAEAITLDEPLCENFVPLVGLEQKLFSMQAERTAALIIPCISLADNKTKPPKISIEILWNREFGRYTILVHPAMSDAEQLFPLLLRALLQGSGT
jgi:hypothetical protein